MTTDLTFITNEANHTLKERFHTLIKDARFFDVLVGYFFASGFHAIYPALQNTEKIRILIGIGTDRTTYEMTVSAQAEQQLELFLSHAEAKQVIEQCGIYVVLHKIVCIPYYVGRHSFRTTLERLTSVGRHSFRPPYDVGRHSFRSP